jgi:uncharacterized integral membrane protein
MTFCPRCGASLKAGATGQAGPTDQGYQYEYRHHRHEKSNEKAEKHGEKHEKGGGGYGYLIAGILIVIIGVLAYLNATTTLFSSISGPEASALFLVAIGVIIVAAGIYYSSRSRRRNPAPT